MLDTKALAAATATIVREHVDKAVAPLLARIGELEKTVGEREEVLRKFDVARFETSAAAMMAEIKKKTDVKALIDEAIAAIPPAQAGKDADPADTAAMVASEVERALAAFPVPQNGKDGQDGAPGERGEKGDPGADGKDGRDGCDVVDAMIDKDGSLVVAFSNGRLKNLGPVIGRDGAPGKDGRDGFGFDDLDLVETDEGLMLRFVKGDVVREFRLPVVLDRGVWKEGGAYRKGDGVTWGRHYWIAKADTDQKPEAGSEWRLAVKSGRDGKDGKDGTPPAPTPPLKLR
jgi:hypothetical protein